MEDTSREEEVEERDEEGRSRNEIDTRDASVVDAPARSVMSVAVIRSFSISSALVRSLSKLLRKAAVSVK